MKLVFVLLVAAIHCRLSIGDSSESECRAARCLTQISGDCDPTESCDGDCECQLRQRCNCHPYTNTECPTTSTSPVCTHVCSNECNLISICNCSQGPVAPPAPSYPTTTTTITEYLSITPTNCLQSTHTKEMSTTIGIGNTDAATGEATCNSSPVILEVFIAVLAALLVAVTTGWIVTCVVNRRKEKASTTSDKDNAVQNPVYDSEHVQRYQGNPSARTQTGYSSQGPAYEQVRVDMETNYDVIDRSGPRPPTTHPVPTSDQDYSTLDTDEQEHDYHVLESNAGGPTAVGGQEPQDYEIPLRKM